MKWNLCARVQKYLRHDFLNGEFHLCNRAASGMLHGECSERSTRVSRRCPGQQVYLRNTLSFSKCWHESQRLASIVIYICKIIDNR